MQTAIGSLIRGQARQIYTSILGGITSYTTPHEFVSIAYNSYTSQYPSNPSINGRIFEYCICETLTQEGITPFYYQATFTFAPIVDFDIVCYHPRQPVILSVKVSLRERYKQAVLEGSMLKGVYGAARSYLLTLSDEFHSVRRQIQEESVVGLTDCLRADSPEFDNLIDQLRQAKFTEAQSIVPLKGTLMY